MFSLGKANKKTFFINKVFKHFYYNYIPKTKKKDRKKESRGTVTLRKQNIKIPVFSFRSFHNFLFKSQWTYSTANEEEKENKKHNEFISKQKKKSRKTKQHKLIISKFEPL